MLTFLESVVVIEPSLYVNTNILFNLVNSGFWNIHLHVSHVGDYSPTIQLDFSSMRRA